MARVSVHLPLNISRALAEMLKEFVPRIEETHGINITVDNEFRCQTVKPAKGDNSLALEAEEASLPDMVIGHIDSFLRLPDNYLKDYFRPLPGRFPIRPELSELGFEDPEGYFHPFAIVPFAVLYNPDLISESELPASWTDLLNPRWQGGICMPDPNHMAPQVIRAYLRANYPDKFDTFLNNSVYLGVPLNVINAVDAGQYPLGITNISFARLTRGKNIRMLWPQDGMICMPMMMIWSKKADDCLLEIGDYLMSRRVQEYLAMQTFVPVASEVPVPQLLSENNYRLLWNGWDDFRMALKALVQTKQTDKLDPN
ncbi:Uncharacterized [Syntrophomonas zehnderi OL-4]|uniref:Uncharacterized n=1 Tax=Syntrophomonas zehnderi OL-4 TaxID=690567 RepID=A0A0E4GBI2_9FIRM|nr:ABC transporter substrate-binding protein [Syntrophomonas zehnderi]CFX45167.1 Uncharacterized [Syntrophomonas zehnderi OL-4]